MAGQTFFCALLMFCIFFTVAKGSCLEYGHSCWGAHGKRSGNNQVSHADMKPASEVDFFDINAIKETPFDSSEDRLNNPNGKLTKSPFFPAADDDEANDENLYKVLKLHNIIFKHLNRTGKQRAQEATADNNVAARRTTNIADTLAADRWRRLPLWKLRRNQLNRENWLNNLEKDKQQQSRLTDDSEDYN